MQLGLEALHLQLHSEPRLGEMDDVGGACTWSDVSQDLYGSSLHTGTEVVEGVLFIPPQVVHHAAKLHEECVQTLRSVVRLQLE